MDRTRRSRKRSDHERKRLVEAAVREACGFPRRGLAFHVDEVEAVGQPLERLTVWATLHFTKVGSPFCCGEPECHLDLRGRRLLRVQDQLRSSMRLRNEVVVDCGERIRPEYGPGVEFHHGELEA